MAPVIGPSESTLLQESLYSAHIIVIHKEVFT